MSKVSIKMLEAYLKRFGWSRYQVRQEQGEKEGAITALWGPAGGHTYGLIIDPIEEKQVLMFHVPKVLSAPQRSTSDKALLELLTALGQINYQIILGKFSYDPRDGEVRFSITLPTDDNTVTYQQFQHCMGVLITAVERYRPTLEQIARGEKTHRDLGEEDEVTEILRRLLDGLR